MTEHNVQRVAIAGFGAIGEAMGGLRYVVGAPDRSPSRRPLMTQTSATAFRNNGI